MTNKYINDQCKRKHEANMLKLRFSDTKTSLERFPEVQGVKG